jgi:phospholipid transport system substrate-binding protein
MQKISVCLISFLFIFQSSLFAYSSNPKSFIDELVKDAITKLSDKNLTKEQKASFVEKVATENVDINALGLYTLGELRKSSSQDEISKYQKSFTRYFLKSLTSRLTDYSESEFEILGEDKKSVNYTIINSKISPSDGGPEIKVDWRVYTKNPEKPLIRDLIVEGLSLARTQKEEFSSILNSNNNDIQELIIQLDLFVSKNQ